MTSPRLGEFVARLQAALHRGWWWANAPGYMYPDAFGLPHERLGWLSHTFDAWYVGDGGRMPPRPTPIDEGGPGGVSPRQLEDALRSVRAARPVLCPPRVLS